jgi:DNA-binding LytR/AlgR family response regulator
MKLKPRILIVEDENQSVQRLTRMLHKIRPHWDSIQSVGGVSDAVRTLSKSEFDLLFFDIHLSDGMSFQILEQASVHAPIIFTTAYDEYAVKAFQHKGLHYLLKPFDEDDLKEAIERYEAQHGGEVAELKKWMDNVASKASYQNRFLVSVGEKLKTIPRERVAYFYAEGKYSYLIDRDGVEYLFDSTLTTLETVLNPTQFFRINRKYIINKEAISDMVPYSKGRLKIELPGNPSDAIVSVDRSPEFKKWILA